MDLGAGVHHDEVGPILFESGAVRFFATVLSAEVEDLEIAGGVTLDAGEVFQDELGEIAVVILDGLFTEGLAVIGGQLEAQLGAVLIDVLLEAVLLVSQERLIAKGPLTIGAAGDLHLEDPEIQTHLDLKGAVVAGDLSDSDLVGLVFPACQNTPEIVRCHDPSTPFAGVPNYIVLGNATGLGFIRKRMRSLPVGGHSDKKTDWVRGRAYN